MSLALLIIRIFFYINPVGTCVSHYHKIKSVKICLCDSSKQSVLTGTVRSKICDFIIIAKLTSPTLRMVRRKTVSNYKNS